MLYNEPPIFPAESNRREFVRKVVIALYNDGCLGMLFKHLKQAPRSDRFNLDYPGFYIPHFLWFFDHFGCFLRPSEHCRLRAFL